MLELRLTTNRRATGVGLLFAALLAVGCRSGAPSPSQSAMHAGSCLPDQGHPAGGQIVFIEGDGFDPKSTATVLFGQKPAPRVHVVTPKKLQAEVPPGTPGEEVVVQVQQSGRTAVASNHFRYFSQHDLHDHDAD